MPGVGHRMRINSSKDEYFIEAVEDAAKGFAISGYNYQKAKQELLKFKDQDPKELIKKPKRMKKKPDKGVQAFYISDYDPRMPHPSKKVVIKKLPSHSRQSSVGWPLPKEESDRWG